MWAAKQTGADQLVDWTLNTTLVMGVTQLTKEGYDEGKKLAKDLAPEIRKGAQALVDYVDKNGAEAGQWLYEKMASQITPEMTKSFNEALDELSPEKFKNSFDYSKGRAPRPFAELIQRGAPQGFGESDANAMAALMKQMDQDPAKRSAGREMSAEYRDLRERVKEQMEEARSFKYSVLNKLERTRTQFIQMCNTAFGDRDRTFRAGYFEADAANKVLNTTEGLQVSQRELLKVQNSFFAEVEGGERLIWRRGAEILGCYLRDQKHLLSLDTSDKELTDTKKKSLTVDWREVDEKAFETWQKGYKDAIESYQTIVWRVQVAKTVATTGVMVGTSFIPGVGALGAFAISSALNVGEKGWQYSQGQMDGGEAVRQILIDGAIDLAMAKWLSRGKALARTSPDAQFSAFKKGVNTETYVKYTDWWGRGAKLSKESPKRVNVHISPVAEKPLISQLKGTNIRAESFEELAEQFSKANAKDGTNVYAATIELVDKWRKWGGVSGGVVAATAKIAAKPPGERPEKPQEKKDTSPTPGGRGGSGKGETSNEVPIQLAPSSKVDPSPKSTDESESKSESKSQSSPQEKIRDDDESAIELKTEAKEIGQEKPQEQQGKEAPKTGSENNKDELKKDPIKKEEESKKPEEDKKREEEEKERKKEEEKKKEEERKKEEEKKKEEGELAADPKRYTVFGNYGGMLDNITFGDSLNTGSIFVSARSLNISPVVPPPQPPPVTPTNTSETKSPPPPPKPGGSSGPHIEMAKDIERMNSLVAEELRIAQAQAQEQALELAVARVNSDSVASQLSHAHTQAQSQSAQTQQAEVLAASLSEAQRIETQNSAAVAFVNAEVVRLKEDVATVAAAQEKAIAAAIQSTQISTTDITDSTAYASAIEQAVVTPQSASFARRNSSKSAAGEDEPEGTIQMNLVGRKPQAPPALREEIAEAAAAASSTTQNQAEAAHAQAQETSARTGTHTHAQDAEKLSATQLQAAQQERSEAARQGASAEMQAQVFMKEARNPEQAQHHNMAGSASHGSTSVDALRSEAQMIETLSSQLTTLDKLEAAARAIEALERHDAHEAEQARKERLAKKARAQSRLRAIIMHQLLTMRFERLKKERMLQLLITLRISEKEYRELVMKLGEREVQAQAERQRRAAPVARPTPSAASRAATPGPSPLKPPVALKESVTAATSQPQPQQPKRMSRAELYVRMKG
jgi:hypothetical protein